MRVLHLLIIITLWGLTPAHAKTLSLQEAVTLAGKEDPLLEQTFARAQALDEQSVADGQLADPKIKFAFQNFPTDNFSSTREGMTQIVAGIAQSFPRGKTLVYKSQRTASMGTVEYARLQEQKSQITLSVQQSWLDLYYWQQVKKTINESEDLLKDVIEATESAYGTGRKNTQDVIRAELELSVLQDKHIDVLRQIGIKQAALGKWIGLDAAKRPLPQKFPTIAKINAQKDIEKNLYTHPKSLIADAMIDVSAKNIKIAKEQYKPGFNVGLNYGLRNGRLANGSGRPDFVSAMVTMDIPLFTKKRQDKELSARKYEAVSADFMQRDTLRELTVMLDTEYNNWTHYQKRIKHYERNVIKRI